MIRLDPLPPPSRTPPLLLPPLSPFPRLSQPAEAENKPIDLVLDLYRCAYKACHTSHGLLPTPSGPPLFLFLFQSHQSLSHLSRSYLRATSSPVLTLKVTFSCPPAAPPPGAGPPGRRRRGGGGGGVWWLFWFFCFFFFLCFFVFCVGVLGVGGWGGGGGWVWGGRRGVG